MNRSVLSRTETLDSDDYNELSKFENDANMAILETSEEEAHGAKTLPIFDFKKYMFSIHYRLERKLAGTTSSKLKKTSKFI